MEAREHPLTRARRMRDTGEIDEAAYRLFVRGWQWCEQHPETEGRISKAIVDRLTLQVLAELAAELN